MVLLFYAPGLREDVRERHVTTASRSSPADEWRRGVDDVGYSSHIVLGRE